MDHQEAIQKYAAEGYLLDELTEAEREAFEEHFADCDDCSDYLRDGLRFATALPAVYVPEETARVSIWQRFAPLAAAASIAAALTACVQYAALVTPLRGQLANTLTQLAKEREPRVISIYNVRDIRAERRPIDGRAPFVMEFDIPPDHQSLRYTCAIADAHGRTRFNVPVTIEDPTKPVDLQLSGGRLVAGDYSLTVTGIDGVPVHQVEFTVR